MLSDISVNKRTEEEFRIFKTLVETSKESIAISDPAGQLIYINPAHQKLFGRSLEEAQKSNYRDFYPPESVHIIDCEVSPALARCESWVGEMDAFDADGRRFPLWEHAGSICDGQGNLCFGFGIMHDISQRKQAEEELLAANEQLQYHIAEGEQLQAELREQAMRDPLTALYNRRYLYETLGHEIARASRENHTLGIIVADIDHFKNFNDIYGHQAGDYILVEIARLMERCTRESDLIYRYGGEEFLLILPGATLAFAGQRAEVIRQMCLETTLQYEGKGLSISMSFGVAAYPDHGQEADKIISRADKAMYQSKERGRNRVTLWSADQQQTS
jgi:diguanylate cyclase (GGDEF)-like protein/PAS domain S-box-containing protein